MIEIRIICDPERTEDATEALAQGFVTGPVRRYEARDGRTRLYVTAALRTNVTELPER
ncbi:hypothetical protein [Streptomyces indicus]|uniref:Uncharacterized protein n=1 Tax=Streptomyces indicus TaxID=417292 RepID=A0A1G9ESZ0_9ACTN|nr:hypothetical protein [Streptomyces indicus]SDK79297.1 hypothetical protein SAMN05421806_11247 [Streptomyces indicus]